MPPPSQRERAEKQRRERLALMDKQVQDGSLTIRQMTPAERKRWPKLNNDDRTPRRRRRTGR
jgi:hypothetical protein